MWKSATELSREARAFPRLDRLQRLYEVSSLWRGSFFCEGYEADERVAKSIFLTPSGQAVAASVAENNSADLLLAILIRLHYHDLLVDWQKSDLEMLQEVLHDELRSRRLILPFRFGRTLYDRFNGLQFPERSDHLFPPDATRLLDGTPQGVYQLGQLVTGPLGLLSSKAQRFLPPTLNVPLWHCADTGCKALHPVKLHRHSSKATSLLDAINDHLRTQLGPASDWSFVLSYLYRKNKNAGRTYSDLPVLLNEALVQSERSEVLASVLGTNHGALLRKVLSQYGKTNSSKGGSPMALASELDESTQLQLLLLLEDDVLIQFIDEAVMDHRVKIAPGEIRECRQKPPAQHRDSRAELSMYGIRTKIGNPYGFLINLICEAYSETNSTRELEWKLGLSADSDIASALSDYVRSKGPRYAVESLILASGSITALVAGVVLLSPQRLRSGQHSADYLLWKLGFSPIGFDQDLDRYRKRIRAFREVVLQVSPIDSEAKREAIRSAGVNLFVSVEDFLSQLVSYSVWLLSSDHFLKTKFVYDHEAATRSVGGVLGSSIKRGDVSLLWDASGNTLGVLLGYLDETLRWVQGLDSNDRLSVERPSSDLPFYASSGRGFALKHTEFWADMEPNELHKFCFELGAIVKQVNQAQLANVRNGIDHFRQPEEFPSADAMLACATRLEESLTRADTLRFFPKAWWLLKSESDRDGMKTLTLEDYQGSRHTMHYPSLLSGLLEPDMKTPCLIAPGVLLGGANASPIFHIRSIGDYSRYWDGYPIKMRPAPVVTNHEGGHIEGVPEQAGAEQGSV